MRRFALFALRLSWVIIVFVWALGVRVCVELGLVRGVGAVGFRNLRFAFWAGPRLQRVFAV